MLFAQCQHSVTPRFRPTLSIPIYKARSSAMLARQRAKILLAKEQPQSFSIFDTLLSGCLGHTRKRFTKPKAMPLFSAAGRRGFSSRRASINIMLYA